MGTIWAQYEKRRNPFRNFEAVLVSYREYKQQLKYGAQTWNRTRDTRIFNPLLYQLSYLGFLAILALVREARIKAFDLRLVKELFGWWDVSFRLIDFFAIKELFTLLREIGSRRNVHHIETQFID